MVRDVTTLQLDKPIMKRFRKLRDLELKKSKERKLAQQDFLVRLMNMYEQTDVNYEH